FSSWNWTGRSRDSCAFPAPRSMTQSPASVSDLPARLFPLRERTGVLIFASVMIVWLEWRSTMLRNTRFQMAAGLAAGTLLGYLAASGNLNPFSRADAARSKVEAASVKPAQSATGARAACCEEVSRGRLLALADPNAKATVARAQKNGKKPNIVF